MYFMEFLMVQRHQLFNINISRESLLTSSQGNYSARWAGALRVLAHIIQALQDPSNGAISTANQNLVVGYLSEYIQARRKYGLIKNIINITKNRTYPGRGPPLSRSKTW